MAGDAGSGAGLSRSAVLAGIAGVLVVALIVAWRIEGRARGSAPPVSSASAVRYVLIGADSHGSVVLDTATNTIVGYDSDGKAVWTSAYGRDGLARASCLAHCPDAVLSAAGEGEGGASAAVTWQLGGTYQSERTGGRVNKVVYAAASSGLAVIGETDRHGRPVVELRDRPHSSVHVRLVRGRGDVGVVATPDLSRGFLVTPSAAYPRLHTLTWLRRGSRGWRITQTATVNATSGCISATGGRAVLIGATTQLLPFGSTAGGALPVAHASSCAFDQAGPVVLASSGATQDIRTEVLQFDLSGTLRWKQSFAGVYSLSAVAASSSVVLYGAGRYFVLGDSGGVVKTGSAQAAALLGPDRVLLVTATASVQTISF